MITPTTLLEAFWTTTWSMLPSILQSCELLILWCREMSAWWRREIFCVSTSAAESCCGGVPVTVVQEHIVMLVLKFYQPWYVRIVLPAHAVHGGIMIDGLLHYPTQAPPQS